MSIVSLANAAAGRRLDFAPMGKVPIGLIEIAQAAATSPATGSGIEKTPGQTDAARTASMDAALNVLFGYIPTEVLTLYVAVLAALNQADKESWARWVSFWCFLAATPVVVWLTFGAKVIAAKKPIPLAFRKWPVWEMFAATVAYFAWALALPGSPFIKFESTWYSAALAGVGVLVASTILGLLSPFFQRALGGDLAEPGN